MIIERIIIYVTPLETLNSQRGWVAVATHDQFMYMLKTGGCIDWV